MAVNIQRDFRREADKRSCESCLRTAGKRLEIHPSGNSPRFPWCNNGQCGTCYFVAITRRIDMTYAEQIYSARFTAPPPR